MKEYRNCSGQLKLAFQDIDVVSYDGVTKSIVRKFRLKKASRKITGLDEVFQNFKLGNKKVGLEWDILFGYIVCAETESAVVFVKEIALFVNSNYNG
jgi:hypothetical protein